MRTCSTVLIAQLATLADGHCRHGGLGHSTIAVVRSRRVLSRSVTVTAALGVELIVALATLHYHFTIWEVDYPRLEIKALLK